MKEELGKRLFIYRRSNKCYGHSSNGFLISRLIFSASDLSAFAMLSLLLL